MRILFVLPAYVPAWNLGGTMASAHDLARHMVALGHPVTVLATNANGPEPLDVATNEPVTRDGVEVWYFPNEPMRMPWPLSRMPYFAKSQAYIASPMQARAARERAGQFDVMVLQNPFGNPNVVGDRAARRSGTPTMYYAHGMLQASHLRFRAMKKRVYLALVEKAILRRAAGLFALTDDEAAAYHRLGLTNPIYVIPNAVDLSGLSTTVVDASQPLIRQLEGKTVVLFLSRIHPTKGVDTLVAAFMELAAKHPDAVLVVAGPDEFTLVPELRARLNRAGMADRALFPSLVSGGLKRDLLARANVFVLPSHMEGFSMCILEAMGSATPVIITPGCHFGEVEKVGAGLIVEVQAPALAQAMDRLLSSEVLRRDMGRRGRQLVEDKYQWSRMARRTIEAYTEAAASARRAR